ncbi:unnamed protein product [Schistosoma mattheei]|uniref:Uncharacterized protein n=1 Tax=Schistosoma mattheei TaxID=31246 RepID=A0A183NMN4_9TREM|nr:unnamed protein product [Schistosoma mattheei]
MHGKTTSVAAVSTALGLNIHKKSKILRYNTACTNPITIDGEDMGDVQTFSYLGSIIDERGVFDADLKARIGKVRAAYLQLKNIWNSKQLSTNTKVRIFNTNVKTVLLYGGTQGNCQPTPRSGFSIQMSRQFYCMGQKPVEPRKPSSRRYRCLLTVVYTKYFRSVGRTLLATTNYGKEQTKSQWRKKLGRSAGSG